MKIKIIAVLFFTLSVIAAQAEAGGIHDTAEAGDLAKVRQLLEQGADVNTRDELQLTPLHWAAIYGKTEVAKLLIEKGADVNARDKNQRTPLHDAAMTGWIRGGGFTD
jgi:ankyrin repeat protein